MPAPTVLISPFKVLTNAAAEFQPVVAAGKDGRFSITWQSTAGPGNNDTSNFVYQGAFIGNGGVGAIDGLGDGTVFDDTTPDAAFLNNGSHVYAFVNASNIYMNLHTKNQVTGAYTLAIDGQVVNGGNQTGNQFMPEVTALSTGGFVVAWQDDNDATIKFQRYNDTGVAQGAVGSVAALGQTGGDFNFDLTALTGGGFAITNVNASGNQSAKISIFDGAGAAVVTNAEASAQVTGGLHGATGVTQLVNGNIVAAWYDSDGGGVGYRLFSSAGVGISADFLIPAAGGASGETPRIAATLDGRFMVVFSGFSGGGVWGQMVNANGTLDGASFQISATGTASQAEIETTADGRVIVTWHDGSDIYAAMYDPRATGINIVGTTSVDYYVGSGSVDVINVDAGNDTVLGMGGADVLSGQGGQDFIDGGDGDDRVNGGGETDTILGGAGNDTLEGDFGADLIYGGIGDDSITGDIFGITDEDGQNNVLVGEAGHDTLVGSAGNDYLYGGADNDSMTGQGGIDVFVGDIGSDTMNGDAGNDYFYSGTGLNQMNGGADNDVFISEGSSDTMIGGSGHNYFYRYATGTSSVTGGSEIDEFVGGTANSNDRFNGGAGLDYGYGGNGNDSLYGGDDNDVLIGENGDDFLSGGRGVNLVWCNGTGNDRVYVAIADGAQTQVVEFFEAGGTNDVVEMPGSTLTSFAHYQALLANLGTVINGNVLYNTGSGAQLYLNLGPNQAAIWFQGVSAYALTASDFAFN